MNIKDNINSTQYYRPSQRGFSLIELIIVALILMIVAAIAVPNLLKSKLAANEASAIASMRTVHSAQVTFRTTEGNGEFGVLTTLASGAYIGPVLGTAPHTKNGYVFEVDVMPSTLQMAARFDLRSAPLTHSLTNSIAGSGSKHFGATETGIIYKTRDNIPVAFDPITRAPQGTATPAGG